MKEASRSVAQRLRQLLQTHISDCSTTTGPRLTQSSSTHIAVDSTVIPGRCFRLHTGGRSSSSSSGNSSSSTYGGGSSSCASSSSSIYVLQASDGSCTRALYHKLAHHQAASAPAISFGRRFMGTESKAYEPDLRNKARKLAVPVGTMAGLFGSLVGVGGGVLISPVIANACKTLPQRVISGTSLAAVISTGTAAGYVYWAHGAVDLTSAAVLAASAVLTAPLGAKATTQFNCQVLKQFLGYWLFAVSLLIPLKAVLMSRLAARDALPSALADSPAVQPAALADAPLRPEDAQSGGDVMQHNHSNAHGNTAAAGSSHAAVATLSSSTNTAVGSSKDASSSSQIAPSATPDSQGPPQQLAQSTGSAPKSMFLLRPLATSDAFLAATGCVAGFASGLLGIGGGTIVTPMLAVFTDMTHTHVLGTALAAMIIPSLVALRQHAKLGNVDWLMAAGLAGGTMLGGLVGGNMAVQAPPGVLESLFSIGMMFLGYKTLQGARKTAVAAAAAVKSSQ